MASYNELNALIDAYINRNGVQAITGQILNGVLKAMVEQLGRGYTIMGAAIPTTDPGTPDGPECYFASETGTYTDFDGLQVVPGELALLCYTPTDGWTKATIYEGFQEVQATIDGNVGTPSVGVSYANGVLSFDFHNMKGNPGKNGQDGQDGAAAGFGTIGADITGGVGTPGVTVESSGPATAKNLQFHFTNLKGETGVTSVVATVDNTTGNPSCSVSLVGQELHLDFTGLKGAQGDTGVNADYPIAIVNNLTTNDPASALSAAQGVVLDGKVTQLEAKVTDLDEGTERNYSPGYYISTGEVSPTNDWFKADDYIPVEPGTIVWNPGVANNPVVMLAFGENKEIVQFYNANSTQRTITIDSATKYVKPSFNYSNFANAKIVNNGKTIWTPRLGTGEIDYRFLQDVGAYINGDNVWKTGTVRCCFMPVTPGQSIFISAGENPAYLAVLRDTVSTIDTTPNFADTMPGRFLATQGQIITIPDDGNYLYISLSASSMPTDSRFFSALELPREKITESNIHLQKEADSTVKSLEGIRGEMDYQTVSLVSGGGINKNNGANTVGTTSKTGYLPITDGYGIFVKGILGTLVTPLALYDASKVFIEAELNSGECFRSADYLKAVGAKYFRCTIGADQVASGDWYIAHTKKVLQPLNQVANELAKLSDVVSTIPDVAEQKSSIRLLDAIGNPLNPRTYQTDESGNEIPSTREVLNVQKKAKQLSDIEWTPLASVPNNNGTFPANVKVKGIPYTSVKECDKYVGWDVSIHTFMTAVNNPYSLLYTENVSAANSQSAWGKTYHGENCSAYFGTVCNEFAKYSAGCDVDFDTPFDKWLHEHRLTFAKVFDQSAQGVRIGDIWWQSGHNRIITGVKRNEDGDVTNVVVSEAVNIKVIVTEMTASAFDALIASQHAIIYRSIELYMNRYTPSPYIPLGDEDATPVTYNDDICTFAGDRATFREGDTIVIDYNLKSVGAWTEMELYKNDELVDTITIDSSAHYVNLTSRNLAYGKYKARMKNGSNYSDFTYWEILQTTVSHAFVAGKSSVTFSSNNGKPWYYILGTQAGNRTVMNSLTDEELSAGKVVVDFNAMQKQQRYNDTDLTGTYYLKVKFRGDYGCVTNDPIPVVF